MRFIINPVLIGMILVLTTATQLRFLNLPLGPGEIAWAGWVVMIGGGYRLGWLTVSAGQSTVKIMGLFWGISGICLGLGAWLGNQAGLTQAARVAHDALAYGLAMASSLAVAWLPVSRVEIERRLLALAGCSMLCSGGLWLLAYGYPDLLGMQFWWYGQIGERFMGWAVNPNQMALLLVMMPFLGLFMLERCRQHAILYYHSPFVILSLMTLTSLAMAAGWATASDALRMAWLVVIPCLGLIGVIYRAWQVLWDLMALLAFAAGIVLLAHWLEIQMIMVDHLQTRALLSIETQETPLHFIVLYRGLEAWLASPWFGLGPGAHSGLQQPFQGIESHNSVVDWATNTGIIGLSALFALGGWVAWRLWRARQWHLLAAFMALALFAQVHHILRHPFVWVWVVLMMQWSILQEEKTMNSTHD